MMASFGDDARQISCRFDPFGQTEDVEGDACFQTLVGGKSDALAKLAKLIETIVNPPKDNVAALLA